MQIDDLTPQRRELLAENGHLLVLGGPGAGKTTIALLKAGVEVRTGAFKRGQRILFLSFARATVARVAQRASKLIPESAKRDLEINTYHGFIWNLLRSHGYLLGDGRPMQLLAPPQAAARLAHFGGDESRETEKRRLLEEERLLHFDLFASVASELLTRSRALRAIVSGAYPLVILDEFQDTNAAEWSLIKTLGGDSRLIALADPEQRIYEFRGADPRRIAEFVELLAPKIYDFGNENYRSDGKDIASFGNDLLHSKNIGKQYKDVAVQRYGFYRGRNALFPLKAAIIGRIKALQRGPTDHWSIAVLVPTKKLMIQVSDYLDSTVDGFPTLRHDVALDSEAPALAAIVLSTLLEGGQDAAEISLRLIADLCQHIRGRRGNDSTPQGELQLVDALGGFLQSGKIQGARRKRVVEGARAIALARLGVTLTGDPEVDWLAVRRLLAQSGVSEYEQVAEDSRYLRLLHKGATLRSRLSELLRVNGRYKGAAAAVRDALLQEHFSASIRDLRGINIMTIHKSKGKEFTDVVIFEGMHQGRIVRSNATAKETAQSQLALRVAVTRAMNHTTILTPAGDPCPFL